MKLAHIPKIRVSLVCGLSLAIASGCGPAATLSGSPSAVPDIVHHGHTDHAPLPRLGELRLRSDEIQSSDFRWRCDDAVKTAREEVTGEIDRRASWITEGVTSNDSDRSPLGYRRENWGGTFPVWLREAPKEVQSDQWKFGPSTNWVALSARLAAVRDQEGGGTWQEWYSLSAASRSLLLDDFDRVITGTNFFLDHRSTEHVPLFRDALSRCVSDPDCLFPQLSNSLHSWAREVSWYRNKLDEISSFASEPKEARALMERYLRGRLAMDARRVEMKTWEHVRRASLNTWVVRLSSAGVESIRNKITEVIEAAWKSNRYQVRIEWVDTPSEQATLPRFVMEETPGERAYVSWAVADRPMEIHLFPNSNSDTIQHEFGHVLGLRDQYFTLFSTQYCGYSVEGNDADIMSHHEKGRVLPVHWRQLNEMYPHRRR